MKIRLTHEEATQWHAQVQRAWECSNTLDGPVILLAEGECHGMAETFTIPRRWEPVTAVVAAIADPEPVEIWQRLTPEAAGVNSIRLARNCVVEVGEIQVAACDKGDWYINIGRGEIPVPPEVPMRPGLVGRYWAVLLTHIEFL